MKKDKFSTIKSIVLSLALVGLIIISVFAAEDVPRISKEILKELLGKLNHTIRDIPVGKDKASERDLLVIKIEGNSRCCSPFFRHPVVSHQFLWGYLDKNFILPFIGFSYKTIFRRNYSRRLFWNKKPLFLSYEEAQNAK